MKRISTLIALAAVSAALGVSDAAAGASTDRGGYRPGAAELDGYRPGVADPALTCRCRGSAGSGSSGRLATL